MTQTILKDLGLVDYHVALNMQKQLFQKAQKDKISGVQPTNHLIICEHPPVFTLGKSAAKNNFLMATSALGADVVAIERGGDVTFHGPGQLVVYPILDLEQYKLSLRTYIDSLEQVVINLLRMYHIHGERVPAASGVWLDKGHKNERKICAVGVKASRYITMHGLAFNVNTDLSWFDKIIPCGIVDKSVTSLQKELGMIQDLTAVKSNLITQFKEVFKMEIS